MAEIKIEKKKPVWPWIIVVLVVLAIIAYFVLNNRDTVNATDDYNDDVNTEQYNDSIDRQLNNQDAYDDYNGNDDMSDDMPRELVLYNESINDPSRIASDSIYTKTAYMNLSRVVVETANDNTMESSQDLEDLKSYSNQINTTNTSQKAISNEISKNFKSLSDKVTNELQRIQAENYPSLDTELSELKTQAADIKSTMSMSAQQEQIRSFLEKARDILKSMNK